MYFQPPTNRVPSWWEVLVVAVALAVGLLVIIILGC